MKAEYNSLIYSYESQYEDIMRIFSEPAFEAESDEINASAAVRDTVKSDESNAIQKTNNLNKAIERVKALIKKVMDIFSLLKRKLENRLRLLIETDKGFYTMYRKRKAMVKPHDNVSVVTYQYVDQILDRSISTLMKEIITCLDKLRTIEGTSNSNSRISEILEAPQGKTIEVLLKPHVKDNPDAATSIPAFIKHIVTKYRGEKREFLYEATKIPDIESRALSTKQLSSQCNAYLRSAQQAQNKIKELEYQIRRNSNNQEVIRLVTSNVSKASILYNAYSTLISAYYELKLEQSLNYRIILKKFYQF